MKSLRIVPLFTLSLLSLSLFGCSQVQPSQATPKKVVAVQEVAVKIPPIPPLIDKQDGFTIERIKPCDNKAAATGKSFILYDGTVNKLIGWSHIHGQGEFKGVALAADRYTIDAANSQADETCAGVKTFKTVLVKKFANWDHQHANGIEPTFLSEGIQYGDVKAIILEMKINSADTHIPSADTMKSLYAKYIDEDQMPAWDAGKINLSVTLFEPGSEEQSEPSFTAAKFIEIDQKKYADQWIRITITSKDLDYFLEQNWGQRDASLAEYAKNKIRGLRINPETKSGKVVRHFIQNSWSSDVPEAFKEMGISIKRLEIQLK